MRRTLEVALGDNARRLGTLRFDAQGARESCAFVYDEAGWLAAPDRFALGPDLPLTVGPHFHRRGRHGSVFHGAIADTEPDGWARRVILRDHAKRRTEDRRIEGADSAALDAVDFLLAVDDASRVGALRFADETGVFQRAAEPGRRTAPPLIELGALLSASRAVEMGAETEADLTFLRGRGTSLGGLRPKCTIIDADGRLSIGKFPSVADDRAVTKGEVLALRLAAAAGIDAAHGSLVESEGEAVAIIRRFDRPDGGGRLMYVSAATMLGVEPEAGEHAYTEIVDALRANGAEPRADTEELWRRMAFSILISNVDDHLRNHGFLHVDAGRWRLAPAFDLNPFPERARELKTWVSEEAGPGATIEALMSVVPYFRIPATRARDMLGAIERAVSGWRVVGRALGMSPAELGQFADAFEHRERDAARRAS